MEHGQIQYDGPSFRTSITTAGYVTIGVSTGIGGIAGFLIGREIRIEDSTGTVLDPDLVGGIGAVGGAAIAGLATTAIILSTAPQSARLSQARVDEWTAGLDERLVLTHLVPDELHRDTLAAIVGIPMSAADTFEIRSVEDARFFQSVFPDHPRQEQMLSRAIGVVPSRDIPSLVDLYPASPSVQEELASLIGDCGSVEECTRLATDYPDYRHVALGRAREHLAKFTDPKTLQRLAIANPEIAGAADTLAAQSVRNGGDPVAYLNSFPRGSFRSEFEQSVGSSIESATTFKELAELAKSLPSIAEQAERRAAEIAIEERKFVQYKSNFPRGASRTQVEAAMESDKQGLIRAAEQHVRHSIERLRKSGEYHSVLLPPDGRFLRNSEFTDWDGDGDLDLFFDYGILGDEVQDGAAPLIESVGAIENQAGVGVFRGETESFSFLPDSPYIRDYSISYASGNNLWLNAWVDDLDDHVIKLAFNGSGFSFVSVRRNDGTQEVQTGGGFIIGD